jgi:hypothetical protein
MGTERKNTEEEDGTARTASKGRVNRNHEASEDTNLSS